MLESQIELLAWAIVLFLIVLMLLISIHFTARVIPRAIYVWQLRRIGEDDIPRKSTIYFMKMWSYIKTRFEMFISKNKPVDLKIFKNKNEKQ